MTFEGDRQRVVNGVNSKHVCDFVLRPIIYDIGCLMAHNPKWKVKFVARKVNMVAHELVRLTRSLFGESIWMEECLLTIMPLVMRDYKLYFDYE